MNEGINEWTMSYINKPGPFRDRWKLKYSSRVIVLQNNNFSASETWFKYLVVHICPVVQYFDKHMLQYGETVKLYY